MYVDMHTYAKFVQSRLCGSSVVVIFGTRDLFNINYSRELYLVSKFLHFEEIVRVKMAVCFEMIVSGAIIQRYVFCCRFSFES